MRGRREVVCLSDYPFPPHTPDTSLVTGLDDTCMEGWLALAPTNIPAAVAESILNATTSYSETFSIDCSLYGSESPIHDELE